MFEEIPEILRNSLGFQMSLLLFVALVGYLIMTKLNQSAIIGQIILGIVIGPSILNLITISNSPTDFVYGIAQLGAIVLLFVIGLEFKIKEVFNLKYGIIALIGVIVPWVCGYFLAVYFGYSFKVSVIIGTALTATSVAITANVLKEMGKLKTEAAKAIIGAAVIDDILSLVVLSFSMQIVGSNELNVLNIIWIIFASIAFILIGAYIGINYLSRLVEKLDSTKIAKKVPLAVFIFAMVIAFSYAMIAEAIGLAAIVGAFLAGVSLEGVDIWHSKSYKEGAEYIQIIFASIFFVSLGVLANFRLLTIDIIWFIIALTIVAIITKIVGCYIGARLVKLSHKVSSVVGVGMIPRGEVAMIVALIGLKKLEVIDQGIYISIIVMSLLTTIFVPAILKFQIKHVEKESNLENLSNS